MNRDPYTRKRMDAARRDPAPADTGRAKAPGDAGEPFESVEALDEPAASDSRIDALHSEAGAAISYAANTLRSVRERYRRAYVAELGRWQSLTDQLDELDRRPSDAVPRLVAVDSESGSAEAAEAGAESERVRELRAEVNELGRAIGDHQTELAKLEVGLRNLETTWLFLKRGDTSLISGGDSLPTELQMRIVEAQEAERSRLAQEIHDGPAQVLSNAIFQVEFIERVIDNDDRLARAELRYLRELLRRELGSVRTFISQLRPPVLDELGLDGAIADAVARTTALTGLAIKSDLAASPALLNETQQTVVLRIVQEALQNVRKHGGASSVIVTTGVEGKVWTLNVKDDGRGFDVGAVAARGRRNFGLQFMQERAELIGARFEVLSRPDGGTIVRLAVPVGREESGS